MSAVHPLITATELRTLLDSAQPPLLLDCGFDLANPSAGEHDYQAGHLPGARYLHLDRDLSGPKSAAGPAQGGRHPLPSLDMLAERAGAWGVTPERLVVCYDRQGGPYAARAWWMLRWLGHAPVRVLDGGVNAWLTAGGTLDTEVAQAPAAGPYPARAPAMPTVDAPTLLASLDSVQVLDARAPERYRGEVEPLDAQAGHIPGARNRFFKDNLSADGRFKSVDELRQEFLALGLLPGQVVHQCGSGVTACHNLLAMALAGLGDARLYPGSWSEWSADPARPVARD
ncbi:sulfurtransferase [Ideonella dechloratans]|uniref:sulfurtransferase n=1 Tax=Ideonella dechloratans TaxID=36863 RepID=UPI0035B1C810